MEPSTGVQKRISSNVPCKSSGEDCGIHSAGNIGRVFEEIPKHHRNKFLMYP